MRKPRTFADYLTIAREQHGLSIRDVARQVGVTPSTISRLEAGKRTFPHPDLFLALVDNLDLDITIALHLVAPYERLCREVAQRQREATNTTEAG